MFYKIERLPDLPVILATWYEGFKFLEHGQAYVADLEACVKQITTPFFYVLDLSGMHSFSLDGLVVAANAGASGDLRRNPLNRGNIFISDADLIKLAAQGMNTESFGHLNIRIYASVDEALDYIRSQI